MVCLIWGSEGSRLGLMDRGKVWCDGDMLQLIMQSGVLFGSGFYQSDKVDSVYVEIRCLHFLRMV